MIHLDTSFLIRALVRSSDEDTRLRGWLREREEVGISALVWAEFLCGPVQPDAVDLARLVVGEPVGFAADQATLAARLFNQSGRRRGTLADCMVAAAAIAADAALATSNASDFQRIEKLGLRLTPRA